MRILFCLMLASVIAFTSGCQGDQEQKSETETLQKGAANMEIISTVFEAKGEIPKVYTCDDKDISPALKWSGQPEGTKSFVLICDDPDAPAKTWVHWVLYGIPPEVVTLEEDVPAKEVLDFGAKHGINDFGNFGYGGPCPPPGKPHRYYFKIYALDFMPDWEPGMSKKDVMKGIEGHILAEGQHMGTYGR